MKKLMHLGNNAMKDAAIIRSNVIFRKIPLQRPFNDTIERTYGCISGDHPFFLSFWSLIVSNKTLCWGILTTPPPINDLCILVMRLPEQSLTLMSRSVVTWMGERIERLWRFQGSQELHKDHNFKHSTRLQRWMQVRVRSFEVTCWHVNTMQRGSGKILFVDLKTLARAKPHLIAAI